MTEEIRTNPPISGTEKETLQGFLDFLRETIVKKCDGLTDRDLRCPVVSSRMTLLGMVKHLAFVERWWMQSVFLGDEVDFPWTDEDPDADWRAEDVETADQIIDLYRQEIACSNEIIRAHDLDDEASNPRGSDAGMRLRWIVVHLIEETARHCGHADLMRETIDGVTGE